ncbi:hypothetical protein [Microbacterium sp. K24]|uniref:hypothetical protein n=1 Tax=Microbacterium sp. K24 TaxID=2305446 RepID=UPI00109CBFE9|nr:hypothetical protein [Microbacterium sp. K24]
MSVQKDFFALDSSGLSAAQIAVALQVSSRTVVRWRHLTGRSRRPPTTPLTEDQLQRARRILEDGASISEAARTIGCSNKTLSKRWPQYAWSQTQAGRFAAMVARTQRAWSEDVRDAR